MTRGNFWRGIVFKDKLINSPEEDVDLSMRIFYIKGAQEEKSGSRFSWLRKPRCPSPALSLFTMASCWVYFCQPGIAFREHCSKHSRMRYEVGMVYICITLPMLASLQLPKTNKQRTFKKKMGQVYSLNTVKWNLVPQLTRKEENQEEEEEATTLLFSLPENKR